jgi:hypothetical protein
MNSYNSSINFEVRKRKVPLTILARIYSDKKLRNLIKTFLIWQKQIMMRVLICLRADLWPATHLFGKFLLLPTTKLNPARYGFVMI